MQHKILIGVALGVISMSAPASAVFAASLKVNADPIKNGRNPEQVCLLPSDH